MWGNLPLVDGAAQARGIRGQKVLECLSNVVHRVVGCHVMIVDYHMWTDPDQVYVRSCALTGTQEFIVMPAAVRATKTDRGWKAARTARRVSCLLRCDSN